jgi:hypothetical protein
VSEVDEVGTTGPVGRTDPAAGHTGADGAVAPGTAAEPGSRRGDEPREPGGALDRRRRRLLVAGLTAVVALPLAIAVVALRTPRWYPLLDLAMTELRVRDVGTRHTPLVGLVGRLSSNGNQGSHLGPISFYALAPVYRLLGGSAWSLLLGVALLNTAAVATTIWIAARRGGARLALGFAAALAVLVHVYGTQVLTEPWNPYMPVMWWTLTLVALWAALCDDLAMLPVAVFAASFASQTHISYVGLVGGFAALTLVAIAVRAHRLRGDRPALRRLLGWAGASLALGLLLWTPTIVDQVTGDPGNVSVVVEHFREPDEEPIGAARGIELLAVHLNPWRLLSGQQATSGSVVPAALLVTAWLAAAVATWRLRVEAGDDARYRRPLLRLHVVLGVALVLGTISATRILGFVWHYLTLWAWGINVLMLVSLAWTAALLLRARRPRPDRRAVLAGTGALATVLLVWTGMTALDAVDAEPTQANYSAMLAEFTDAVTDAIDTARVPGGGPDGRYLITWTDGVNLGSTGFGLLSELERRGYDVGVISAHGPGARPHRVMDPDEATAEIHISFGPDIERWQAKPEAEQIVYVDQRTEEDLAAYERARSEAVEALRRAGRDELVEAVDTAPFQLYFDDRVPEDARGAIKQINDIGQPAAVFASPVTIG